MNLRAKTGFVGLFPAGLSQGAGVDLRWQRGILSVGRMKVMSAPERPENARTQPSGGHLGNPKPCSDRTDTPQNGLTAIRCSVPTQPPICVCAIRLFLCAC